MFATLLALGGISVSTVGAPLLTVQAAEEATVAAKEYKIGRASCRERVSSPV